MKWGGVQTSAADQVEACRPLCRFAKSDKNHRRGKFPALACGITIGPGGKRPVVLDQEPANQAVFERLFEHDSFKQMSGYSASKYSVTLRAGICSRQGSGVLASWSPKFSNYSTRTMEALHQHHPDLRQNFSDGAWAAATVNFGPRTVCFKHKDFNNLAFGWCAITSLGNFDPSRGGHLILWELGLVITFPAGATVLIPSACISHSNTAVGSHETRYSFTQYSAGGLFRWVERGFQKKEEFFASLNEEQLEEELQREQGRLEWGLSLFSTIDELRAM